MIIANINKMNKEYIIFKLVLSEIFNKRGKSSFFKDIIILFNFIQISLKSFKNQKRHLSKQILNLNSKMKNKELTLPFKS